MSGSAENAQRRLPRLAPGESADVGLLLEGTYPYVSGGVSSWVHEIITGLPDLSFGVIFLGASPESYGEIRYQLPRNLVHLETHYLMSEPGTSRPIGGGGADADADDADADTFAVADDDGGEGKVRPRRRALSSALAEMIRLHDAFKAPEGGLDPRHLDAASALGGPGGISLREFLSEDEIWARLCNEYDARCPTTSFLDYFWTVRTMHRPLFTLAELARRAPGFRLVHAVSTGYAGFLGALLQRQRGCPFIVTEHGIYTKERKIDLARAAWIRDEETPGDGSLGQELGYLRRLWIRFFEGLGRAAYASARPVVSLYEGNRARQIEDGAAREHTRVIPNGIDITRFAALRAARPAIPPPVLGLVGRVVPIKDIKTFVRAMRTVVAEIPDAQGWIVGPDDEDPRYADECRALARSLGLERAVRFLGFRPAEEVLPQLGLGVLTSISEALPLFVLESFAAGVPVVATDVGSCRALVEGGDAVDRARGVAGAIAPFAAPEALARAAVELLRDPARWRRAAAAAVARVEALYTRDQMFTEYRALYRAAFEEAASHGRDRLRAS
ncbi:MAG TPA: GT4 family glycosyltransferase PelF [Polyangia bacterium]|nr:GT4 family glycosyltransferase PelF [Polyangia bacterium]